MSLSIDRISSLPKNVIEAILTFLPIRDAVRTSCLSRSWRYEWSNLSQLVFDNNCFLLSRNDAQIEFDNKLVKAVDQVLLLHCHRIHKFKLSTHIERNMDIDRWILFLSRNGIREFTLDKWRGELYKLPSSFFSFLDVTYLELYRCRFIPPDWFTGFRNLTTMDLQHVSFCQNSLELLISSCPLLSKLILKNIDGCPRLKICAQKLVDLSVEGEFEDLCFEDASLLAIASIKLLTVGNDHAIPNEAVFNLTKFLGCLPNLNRLELHERTLQFFAVGDVPVATMTQLKHLIVNINFEDLQELLCSFGVFRSSPALQRLDIEAASDENTARVSVEDFWDFNDLLFGCLQSMKVTKFTGTKSELCFIKFVLANSPILETVQIELKKNVVDEMRILKELVRFRRMSAKAELFYSR